MNSHQQVIHEVYNEVHDFLESTRNDLQYIVDNEKQRNGVVEDPSVLRMQLEQAHQDVKERDNLIEQLQKRLEKYEPVDEHMQISNNRRKRLREQSQNEKENDAQYNQRTKLYELESKLDEEKLLRSRDKERFELEISQLQETIQQLQKRRDQAIEEEQETRNTLRRREKEWLDQKHSLEGKITKLEARIREANNELQEQKSHIHADSKQNVYWEKKASELGDSLNKAYEKYEKQVEELRKDLEQESQKASRASELENEVYNLKTTVRDLEHEIHRLEEGAEHTDSTTASTTTASTLATQSNYVSQNSASGSLEPSSDQHPTCTSQGDSNAFSSRQQKAQSTLSRLERECYNLRQQVAIAQRNERKMKKQLDDALAEKRNTAILEEEIASEKAKAERAEQANREASKLRTEMEKMRAERAELENVFVSILGESQAANSAQQVSSENDSGEKTDDASKTANVPAGVESSRGLAEYVLQSVKSLQQQHYAAIRARGTAEASLASSQRQISSLRSRISSLEKDLDESENQRLQIEEEKFRLERRVNLLTKERDHLKEVIASYDREDTLQYERRNRLQKQADSSTQEQQEDDAKRERIKHLESMLEQSNERIHQLEEQEKQSTPATTVAKLRQKCNDLQDSLRQSEKQVDQLQSDLQKTQIENERLKGEIGRGAYNPETTKVLHMKKNPAKDEAFTRQKAAEEELERLKEENNQLKAQIQQVSAQSSSSSSEARSTSVLDVSTLAADAGNRSTTEDSDTKKRVERLKDLFGKKMRQFREAVYLLTGYKVDMNITAHSGETQLVLRSMYAEREEDYLQFKMTDGKLEMLETPFCARIDSKVTAYLTVCKSVPAFLSNLTLDLFEKTTFTAS